uniref:Uncharacterized protein n=1 Tax=Salix viminalis TaxID=40686 RepID=A0A6N2M2D5_SALVM
MGDFEKQVKERAKELKVLFKKGVKIVEKSCKKGWKKITYYLKTAQVEGRQHGNIVAMEDHVMVNVGSYD